MKIISQAAASSAVMSHLCAFCNTVRPTSAFKLRKDGSPGGRCAPCLKAYKAAHYQSQKDRYKDRASTWRENNRERYLENGRTYYQANRDECLARSAEHQRSEASLNYRAQWAAENKERRLAAEQAYRDRNRDVCNARIREWKSENKHRVAAHSRKRGGKVRAHTPKWASFEAMAEFYALAARLTAETGVPHHVDHIVPIISDLVCGLHCEANLQVLRYDENVRKGNRWWPDMPA